MGDLNAKRGKIQGMDQIGGGKQVINALVPQGEVAREEAHTGTGCWWLSGRLPLGRRLKGRSARVLRIPAGDDNPAT